MKSDAEVFLLIDADTTVTPDQLMQLVESEKLDRTNAVSGCYLAEAGRIAALPAEQRDLVIGGEPRFVELLVAGLGCAAVHRDTVDVLNSFLPSVTDASGACWAPSFVPFILEQRLPDGSVHRQYMPEDHSFWWRLRTVAKAQCWIDTHLAVGHVKPAVFLPEKIAYTHPSR